MRGESSPLTTGRVADCAGRDVITNTEYHIPYTITSDLHLDCKYVEVFSSSKHYRHVLTPKLLIKDAQLSAVSVSDTIVTSPEGSSVNTNAIPAHQ